MESTATWMEERIATTVNDNRQYLPLSQIYAPYLPLDLFSRTERLPVRQLGVLGVPLDQATASASSRRPGSRPAR